MRERTRQELWVLAMIFGILYLLAMLYAGQDWLEQWSKKEHQMKKQTVEVALSRAYAQLINAENNSDTHTNQLIQPLEFRSVLEVHSSEFKFGELTPWAKEHKL